MKFKKILIPSMGTVAIVSPVATLVACGSSKEAEPDWQAGNDLATTNALLFNKLKALSTTDNSAIKMDANILFERVVNSEAFGMLDVVRLQDFNFSTTQGPDLSSGTPSFHKYIDLDGMIDTSVVVNGKNQTADMNTTGFGAPVSFWNKHVKKADLKTSAMVEAIAAEVETIIKANPNDRFGALVVENQEDNKVSGQNTFDGGEYTIHLFKMKKNAPTSTVAQAEKMFQDNTKFGIDEKRIKEMGGIYTLSYAYHSMFSAVKGVDETKSQDIWTNKSTVMTSTDPNDATSIYKDRTNEYNLNAYYGFGPKATFVQAEMDKFRDMNIVAYPIQDKKTKEWNLVITSFVKGNEDGFTIMDPTKAKKLAELSTIIVPMPLLNNFASTKTYSVDRMKDLIVNSMSFERVFKIVDAIPTSLLGGFPIAASYVQDMFKATPYMYQTKPLLSDTSFLTDFIANVKSFDSTFDMPTFTQILEWTEGHELGDFAVWGAKRQSLITMLPRFYKDVEKFVASNPNYAKRLYKLEDIKAPTTK